MAVGGGDEIGASSYYLQIGDTKLLLDFGLRSEGNRLPDYDELLRNALVKDMYDIKTIIISHAHKDHYEGVRYLEGESDRFRIIATSKTKERILGQINTEKYETDHQALKVKNFMHSIISYEYFDAFYSGEVKITFLPAGHMRGAAMTLLEYKTYKVLYTGDFSMPLTAFVQTECEEEIRQMLKQCDVLIMESTHGQRDEINIGTKRHADYNELVDFVRLVSPKHLFLVHQNIESKAITLMEQIQEEMPDINVVRVENKRVYEVEMK